MTNQTIHQGVIKVTWLDGNWKWYRVTRRTFNNLVMGFKDLPNFHYAKVYAFSRKTRLTGKQLGYFGINIKTGEFYSQWLG